MKRARLTSEEDQIGFIPERLVGTAGELIDQVLDEVLRSNDEKPAEWTPERRHLENAILRDLLNAQAVLAKAVLAERLRLGR